MIAPKPTKDNDPMLVKINRDLPMTKDNALVVSARAGMLIEQHSKQDMLDMLASNGMCWSGYSRAEVERIAQFIDN